MKDATLFKLPEPEEPGIPAPTRPEEARVLRPERNQIRLIPVDLESLIRPDDPARVIWAVLEKMDLSAFYSSIKAVVDRPGRPPADPQVLLAVWLLGTVHGVGSARKLARLCEEHDAYRWLCGGVPTNYHMLSDFRVSHQRALDDLLVQIIASLMAAKAVKIERVAQDGMRVRASAGASSFRGKQRLETCLKVAREQVKRLAEQRDHPDPGASDRERSARERAAREREERITRALGFLPKARNTKELQQRNFTVERRPRITKPRASITDPEANVMKMPDGGFRPAYNVQLATDQASGVIVGISVNTQGTDAGHAVPMEGQVEKRTAKRPGSYLMDGGFATKEDITELERRGVTVFAPVRLPRNKPERERYKPRYGDSPEVARWRQRMATIEAKTIYRQRGATAEWANAQMRLHGVSRFTVRGLAKVTTVMLIAVIAHNILRWSASGI